MRTYRATLHWLKCHTSQLVPCKCNSFLRQPFMICTILLKIWKFIKTLGKLQKWFGSCTSSVCRSSSTLTLPNIELSAKEQRDAFSLVFLWLILLQIWSPINCRSLKDLAFLMIYDMFDIFIVPLVVQASELCFIFTTCRSIRQWKGELCRYDSKYNLINLLTLLQLFKFFMTIPRILLWNITVENSFGKQMNLI